MLTGTFVDVTANGTKADAEFGLKALYSKHPAMPSWGPPGTGMHNFHVFKLEIESIFFLGYYGGAAPLSVGKYLSTKRLSKQPDKAAGAVAASAPPARPSLARPPAQDIAAVARWLVSSTVWGVIATVSNGYGNFDIILARFSRVSQLHPTPHAPCTMLYLAPMLVVC